MILSVKPNPDFVAENKIADGIMRKGSTTAKVTLLNTFEERPLRNLTGRVEFEIERKKKMFTPLNLFCFYSTGVQGSIHRLVEDNHFFCLCSSVWVRGQYFWFRLFLSVSSL